MTDYIGSLFDNFKSKIRNPFIGTIISVWIIRNWVIIYAIFNFDSDRTMLCKINFISSYFSKINFWVEFFANILTAMSALLITFILLAISRIITDGYYKIIEPLIITRIDKGANFTTSDRIKLEKKIVSLNQKLDSEIDALSKAENINENLRKKNIQIEKQYQGTIENLNGKVTNLNDEISSLETQYKKYVQTIERFEKINSRLQPSAFTLLKRIKMEPILDDETKKYNNEAMQELLSFDLVKISNSHISVSEMGKLIIVQAELKN